MTETISIQFKMSFKMFFIYSISGLTLQTSDINLLKPVAGCLSFCNFKNFSKKAANSE